MRALRDSEKALLVVGIVLVGILCLSYIVSRISAHFSAEQFKSENAQYPALVTRDMQFNRRLDEMRAHLSEWRLDCTSNDFSNPQEKV